MENGKTEAVYLASFDRTRDWLGIDAVVSALTPLCVTNANADPERLAEVKELSSYQQRQAINDTGWATYPEGASSSLTRAIDQGCVDALR